MLKNRIIPCLDVKNGRVVKGINFVDLKDAGDPVEQAKIYSNGGADEICFLDITASNENRDTIYNVVDKTSKNCFQRRTYFRTWRGQISAAKWHIFFGYFSAFQRMSWKKYGWISSRRTLFENWNESVKCALIVS